MRIKLDENLPRSLVETLNRLGHDAHHVVDEGLSGRDDLSVWAAAQVEERFLITQDVRFANSRSFPPGSHHGLLLLRMRDVGSEELKRAITSLFTSGTEVETWGGCFVVFSGGKLRVRRG